ncbi:hypothetical protein EI555_013574, partial [Monodon monoceros]
MAAPSSDGCREERPGHVSLQVAVEGTHGSEVFQTPHILSLSHHRLLSRFPVSDLISFWSRIFLWWVLSEDPCCTGDGLGSMTIMGFFLCLGQLLSTCVPFLLVASEDTLKGDIGPHPKSCHHCHCILRHGFYASCHRSGLGLCPAWRYVLISAHFGRRLENYVAFVIFGFISNTDLYLHQPALIWRVAVYSICFILGAVNFIVNGCDCDNEKMLPIPYPSFLMEQTYCLVLWPLYQFDENFGGQAQWSRDVSCSDELRPTLCIWDQRLAVAILTTLNLLAYVADSMYMALYFV